MQRKPHLKQVIAVGATCAVAGAGAGIAGSMAAPKSKQSSSAQGTTGATGSKGMRGKRGRGFHPPGGHLRRGGFPIHSEMVVPKRSGSGFTTVTTDAGKLKSVDGNTLTVTEGTDTEVYKTVDIDVGGSAKVHRNGKTAKVSDLKAGDFVLVAKDDSGYRVHAVDAATRKAFRNRGPRGRGPGRPGGPGGPGRPGFGGGPSSPGGPPPGA